MIELALTILYTIITAIKLLFFGGLLVFFVCGYTIYYLVHNYFERKHAHQESRPTE